MSEDIREFRSVESTHIRKSTLWWGPAPKYGKPQKGDRFVHQGKIKTVKHSECFKRGIKANDIIKGDFIAISFFHEGDTLLVCGIKWLKQISKDTATFLGIEKPQTGSRKGNRNADYNS